MRRATAVLLVLTTGLPVLASAEEHPLPPSVADNSRRIDGMIFIPSRLVRDPFIYTAFGLTGQYGIGNADAPGFNVLGQPVGGRTYQLGELSGTINFSGAVLPWLSFHLGIEDAVFSGVNAPSALVAGISALAGGSGGITGSWAVGDNLRVGFIADVRDRERIDLLPLGSVAASIQARAVDLSGFAPITNILTGSGGGVIAFGFARCFATELTLEYTYERIARRGVTTVEQAHDMSVGAVAELDFNWISPVPIGILGAYRLDNTFESNGTHREHHVDVGLYYTGRPNVVLGLNAGGDFRTLRENVDTRAFLLTFVLTYFWG